jgi:FkbM family methyltransferase
MRGLLFIGGETGGYALGASEPAVQRALEKHLKPGAVFYDVGANVGFLSLLAAKLVGPSGHVVCFEPFGAVVPILRQNLEQNGMHNYEIVEAAVGDRAGTARLATDRGSLRAMLTDDADAATDVRLVTLDEVDKGAPAVVKIDVEGAESRVLRGMTNMLRDDKPVLIIEIHGDQHEPVTTILREAGYDTRVLNDDGMPHLIATPLAVA